MQTRPVLLVEGIWSVSTLLAMRGAQAAAQATLSGSAVVIKKVVIKNVKSVGIDCQSTRRWQWRRIPKNVHLVG